MSMTLITKVGEILDRPTFAKFDDSTKLTDLVKTSIKRGIQEWWELNRDLPVNERTNMPGGYTLPVGTAWSANGKIYILDSATSPVLGADVDRITKLWIVGDSGAIMFSESTYSSDSVKGSGIPDASDETLDATSVYHEVFSQDDTRKLAIYIGNTAAGSAPKACINYVIDLTLPSADSDKIPVPDTYIISGLDSLIDKWLRFYVGFDY